MRQLLLSGCGIYDEAIERLLGARGNPIIGRRTDAKYCSNDCSWNFYVKNNWRMLRIKILRRDRFTCQLCGDKRSRVKINGKVRRNFNVDHKVPIFKGGNEFDESNLWTLCIICHRAKTRIELAQRNNKG